MKRVIHIPVASVILVALFILSASVNSYSQRVKYKDLYYLLSGKNYDEAEPFLKKFLSESSKNADHPNANYQMAVIYKRNAELADIFQESDKVWIYSDSAVYYYGRARELITDKEVKRNSEYYEIFQKRDMRTGKVSVKAFDVQFYIDEIVEKIKERQTLVADVNDKLLHVITQYNKSRRYFIEFKSNNKDLNQMLLRANLKTIGALDHLLDTYDSFQTGFTQMKNQLQEIPKSGYSQQIRPQPITDFVTEGESESRFLDDDIKIWNYEEWSRATKKVILDDILPTKALMVSHDEELESILEKARKDSSIFTPALNAAKAKWNSVTLLKYDKDPLPPKLFNLRYAELEYFNSMLKNMEFRNSQDFSMRIGLLEAEKILINKMDSLVDNITRLDIDEQIRNYTDYVDKRYKGYLGLDKFLKDRKEAARQFREKVDNQLAWLRDRNAYMLVDETRYYIDSTFLSQEMDSINYVPRYTDTHFSSGYLSEDEEVHGYLVEVNPQRVTNIFYNFSLDSAEVGEEPDVIATTDNTGQVFYLLYYGDTIHTYEDVVLAEVEVDMDSIGSDIEANKLDSLDNGLQSDSTIVESTNGVNESGQETTQQFHVIHPAILCKIYRVDGVAWIVPLNLKERPVQLRINDLGEVVVDEASDESGRIRSMLIISNKDGAVKSD